MNNNRRSFLKTMAVGGVSAAGLAVSEKLGATNIPETNQEKTIGRKKTGNLRFGFIGTGSRCNEHIKNVLSINGNTIVAICDTQKSSLERTLKRISDYNVAVPKVYTGNDFAFEQMLSKEDFDCVIIATPWEWHVRMAVAAMKAGVPYVGLEVSAANTLEECWDLVNASESSKSQLYLLENVCYRRDCMAVLNMVRQGLFGELIHARCGYEHDLRDVKFNDGESYTYKKGGELKMGSEAYSEAQWRALHSIKRNGDLYPTHGIGPVANCLDINCGNRFLTLSAMATQSRGLHKFIIDNGGASHPYKDIQFNLGDIITSTIKCANGQTIIATHDTNSPRPYSLGFRIQGTNGLWINESDTVYIEGQSAPHKWDEADDWFKKYDHELWSTLEAKAREAGHGGMDFIMIYDLVDTVRNGRPSPLDCYDAASWSAVTALSEMSIARGGAVVDFPDFTRGQWILRESTFAV